MPTQKDLKRLVRARMKKTGESYTAARAQILTKNTNVRLKPDATNVAVRDYAKLAGMSDAKLKEATGCTWERWVKTLDKAGAANMSHREIAKTVAFFKTPSWWTQMVTVGYERIRGLREKGQQRGGGYRTTKSRTIAIPLGDVYEAFSDPKLRRRWLPGDAVIKSASPKKRVRLAWSDGSSAIVGFYARGESKSLVAVEHGDFPDKATADSMKAKWNGYFDKLEAVI